MTELKAPALEVSQLTKSFAGTPVLQKLDLEICSGEIHALVGENGSGKSTFIKLLAGVHKPDSGSVAIGGLPLLMGSPNSAHELGCRFVHQDLGLVRDLSVLDNISITNSYVTRLYTIRTGATRRMVRSDLARVGITADPATLVRELSPALQTGVAVARALRTGVADKIKLLVLDEPTAALPDDEVNRLIRILKSVASTGVAILYVTHRLDEVFLLADNVSVLRDGRLVGTAPTGAISRNELVHLLVGAEYSELATEAAPRHPSARRPDVLVVRDLSAASVVSASFSVRSGEILGMVGVTGSGREAVLSAVFGGVRRTRGEVILDGASIPGHSPGRSVAAGIAYLPADRKVAGAVLDFSARENLTLAGLRQFTSRFTLSRRREEQVAREWFDKLAVRPSRQVDQIFAAFSGGNQQKILFAKWFRTRPKVFLLDEPTQGVDVGAKALLHRALRAAAVDGVAVVISSTDMEEIATLCHRVIIFRNGFVADELTEGISVESIARACLGTVA